MLKTLKQPDGSGGGLSETQWRILQMVAQGIPYREIAASLGLRERTVKYHIGRTIKALGVENRSQAIACFHDLQRGHHTR